MIPLLLSILYARSFDRYAVAGTGDVAVLAEAGSVYLIVGDTDRGVATGPAGENGLVEEETDGVAKVVWERGGTWYVRVGIN